MTARRRARSAKGSHASPTTVHPLDIFRLPTGLGPDGEDARPPRNEKRPNTDARTPPERGGSVKTGARTRRPRRGDSPATTIRELVVGHDTDLVSTRHLWQDRSARPLHHPDPIGTYAAAPVPRPAHGGTGASAEPPRFMGKRVALYSAIIGGYDPFHTPAVAMPGLDRVVFTDAPLLVPPGVQLRNVEYVSDSATRTSRYVKLHPHLLLRDYDYAVWLDANVFIAGDISDVIAAQIESGMPVGAITHPERHSVYQEAAACIRYGKDDANAIREQVRYYDRLDFDCDDLFETNLLMLDLRHPSMARFLASWWQEIERFSPRDQISFNRALRLNRLSCNAVLEPPRCLRSHPSFRLLPHGEGTREIAEHRTLSAGGAVRAPAKAPSTFVQRKSTRLLAQRRTAIDIVICVKDALEDVQRCLESVLAAQGAARRNIVIVDDGSSPPTRDYLAELCSGRSDAVLLRNETARGYTRAANQGLARSTSEFVILLNSDTVVSDWWAEKLADALASTPGAGLVGPLSNAASWQSLPSIDQGEMGQTAINPLPPGRSPGELDRLCEEWTGAELFPLVPLIHGFCFGISRRVIDRIGYFDDRSFPNAYGEENDYCFRAIDAGFDAVVATSTYVFHAKTRSYTDADRRTLAQSGREALRELHGDARIRRSIATMIANPTLVEIRKRAEAFYRHHDLSSVATPKG